MNNSTSLIDNLTITKQSLELMHDCQVQLAQFVGDEDKYSHDRFDAILRASISSLLDSLSTKISASTVHHDDGGDDGDVARKILKPSDSPIHSALVYLLVESARIGATSIDVGSYLEECHTMHSTSSIDGTTSVSLTSEQERRVEAICHEFDAHRRRLRRTLLHHYNRGFQFVPQLIDLDYRLDYVVKTSDLQRTNEVLYTLRFICSHGADADEEDDVITMTCTVEQLQDLYNKLKDATHQVQRTLAQK